jgi:TRAP-type C4-dicarboxylate transport system substrate-binding protein
VVKDPANDFKNKTVRASGKYNGEGVSFWGGAPVNMAAAEVPTALERKTIDMVLTALPGCDGFKMYESAPYVTLTGFCEPFCGAVMNLDKWNSLSKAQQDAVMAGASVMENEGEKLGLAWKEETLEKYRNENVGLYVSTDEDRAWFKEKAMEIINSEILPNANENTKILIDILQNDPTIQ